jgi:hypothetical protein
MIDATGKRTEKIAYAVSKTVIRVSRLGEEGKFLLAIANSKGNKLNVKIFNAENDLIHTESKEITGDYAQVYKVTNTSAVTFEVSDNAGNTQVVSYY